MAVSSNEWDDIPDDLKDQFYTVDLMQEILPHIYRYRDSAWHDEVTEQDVIQKLADEICSMIDQSIMDEIIKEVEKDKEIVKYILPNKLFEV